MKKAEGLPVNTLVIVIIAIIVLAIVVFFFTAMTGKNIFPSIAEKIKMALGLWNSSVSSAPVK